MKRRGRRHFGRLAVQSGETSHGRDGHRVEDCAYG
jgi:hypothetical protein